MMHDSKIKRITVKWNGSTAYMSYSNNMTERDYCNRAAQTFDYNDNGEHVHADTHSSEPSSQNP